MDFFGAQHQARRRTWQLAALFGAALASLVLLTNLLVAAVYAWTLGFVTTRSLLLDPGATLRHLPAGSWAWISLAVLSVVGVASLYKYRQLQGGGRAVAEALGAELVHQRTRDPALCRLLNVVEEMAIASGLPVPPVYRLTAPGINAFAAGLTVEDAVIGVSQGALEHLTRDELQGIIAHEFSHLLNGDSRLNLRLMAVLHGILFIGLVGRGILQGSSRGSRRRGPVSGGAPVLALGAGLTVIGYAGTFFGNLIKAAVSRQREYLADAAAVQFTRNPASIAGALKKIGSLREGSTVHGAAAGEASHLFFGQIGPLFLNRLMATHPPLRARIRQVDPRWNGRFPRPPRPLPLACVDEAARLIGGLPAPLRDAAHDPWSARALLYALVADPGVSSSPLQRHGEAGLAVEAQRLHGLLEAVDEPGRVTLLEMAVPALKELSDRQYRHFMTMLLTLIKHDGRIDLMEWVLHRVLVKDLEPHFDGPTRPRNLTPTAAQRDEATRVLLSILAREAGRRRAHEDGAERIREAFARGLEVAGLRGTPDTADDPNFVRLNRALRTLRELPPLSKPRLIKACAATVLVDGGASARARALLHGIAATLDCPLPPIIYERPTCG